MMTTRKVPGPRPAFRPKLEVLENRDVPACTAVLVGTTLTITGDSAPNVITINDAGDGAINSITVVCDGALTTIPPAVIAGLTINIDTLGGGDVVVYNLNGDLLTGQARTLNVNLGDKNDTFQATAVEVGGLSSDLATGSSLVFNVNGQKGKDNLYFDFSKDPNVIGTASLIINANGNQNKDRIALNYDGAVDGTFSINLNGNQDQDKISTNVNLDGGSAGTFTGLVNGQGGNDLLTLIASKSTTFTGTTTGQMNGGSGSNTGIASSFVVVTQVEDLFQLPF